LDRALVSRVSFLVMLSIAALASAAFAKIPAPERCSVPDWIRIVGAIDAGASADPYGLATIQIRDIFNNPEYADVELDFSSCCDLRVCGAYFDGVWIEAIAGKVTGHTDGLGKASFVVLGAAVGTGSCGSGCSSPGGWLGCVRARASAGTGYVEIRRPAGVALDQNGACGAPGANGVTGADVSCVIHTVGAALVSTEAYRARSDLNQDGVLTAADVSEIIAQFGRLALAQGVGCSTPYSNVAGCP
jgi:hypothetical protein